MCLLLASKETYELNCRKFWESEVYCISYVELSSSVRVKPKPTFLTHQMVSYISPVKNQSNIKNRASWATERVPTRISVNEVSCVASSLAYIYRGADKSLARPGRKQATGTEDFDFHVSYL